MNVLTTYAAEPGRYDGRMPYRRSGASGLKLPLVSLGLWHNFGDTKPLEEQRAILRRGFDLGVAHFDLANNYGPPSGFAPGEFRRLVASDFRPFPEQGWSCTKAGSGKLPGP